MDKDEEKFLLQSVGLTQKLLTEHITKPALSEKYLIKPPFRFLHEIVTSVIETTGFMKDTFPQSHLKYEKISNVDEKRSFLKTAIDAIESETNQKCEARPSKILSGKEPEKTNELLQLLAKAISSFKSKDNSKPSGSKGAGSKTKPSQKAVDNKSKRGSRTKSEVHQDVKRARSRPPVKNQSSHKSTSQENLRREKVLEKTLPDVSSQSKNKLDSKKSISRNKGNLEDASSRKSVTQLSTPSNKSDESLKSKISLTTTISPKQVSASKSISKQSLVKKSSSSKLLPVDPRKSVKQVEKVSSQESTAGSSKEKAKDVKSSEYVSDLESTNITGKVSGKVNQSTSNSVEPKNKTSSPTAKSNTGMPPETMEEVPAQRPVTRKKQLQNYNESNDSNVNPNADDTSENANLLIPATATSEEQEQILKSPLTPESTVPATTTTEQEDQNKSGSRSSSACSSSDEAVTEHMNQKISEWKGDSEGVATAESVEDVKTGWIPESSSNQQCKTNSSSFESLDKVFKSRESFSQQCQDDDEISMSRRKVKASTPSETAMKRPITVMLDNQDDDEDDETFLVQERVESETDLTLDRLQSVLINTAADIAHIPQEHRGLLVNQIMETQRELEQLSSQKSMFATLQNEMAERDKEALREVYLKQIEDLKGAIQKMAKCANPLANIIQRSQDDACLMEIEFRKLRQENERLQRKIDEARLDTTRVLFPMTEELAHLDSRIEKMEGAIVLAKQRLQIMDEEYQSDYICPISMYPTQDEVQDEGKAPIWEFKGGNSSEDDGDRPMRKPKSMLDVFRRAVSMHENEACNSNIVSAIPLATSQHLQPPIQMALMDKRNEGPGRGSREEGNFAKVSPMPLGPSQGARYSGSSFTGQGLGAQPQFPSSLGAGLRGYGDLKERPLEKEIKPPWWD